MADLRIKGDISGYVDLVAPDAAGSTTIDLSKVITSTGSATTLDANNVVTSNTATTFTEDVIFAGGDNCVDLRIGTDKRIAFSGNIGEIGNVPGFQAMNTAGSANVGLGMRGTDIRFATGSAERMRVSDNGVGIGNSIDATVGLELNGSGNTSRIKIIDGSSQLNIGLWDGANYRVEGDANRKILITSYHSDGVHIGGSGASDLVVAGGNVGIGTGTAIYGKLGIGTGLGGGNVPANTSILLGSDDNRNIQFLGQTANGNEGTIGAWNGVYNFQSSKIVFNKPAGNLGEMLFYTNAGAGPVLRVAMTNHGRVVFSPSGVADGQGVTTYANGANGHYVSCTGTSNYWITNHGVASATGTLSTFYNNGTYCGGISISSTNVTSYVSASDYRLKENVVPMTGATERLKQLNPVTFDWINSGESSEGFIAHEVGAIVPISTTGTKDEVYDEEGAADNPKINEGDPKYQSVDPAKLVPLLVKTIQELEARITALETGN